MSIKRPLRLSFLTPAYRTEAYLADTITSVISQTSPMWELVVVDNGNSDAIASIVRSFDDPRIKLVRQENRGYRGGVMAAAAAANGDYLCVLDSDDLLTPEFAITILDYLESHPEVDAVGCDAHLFMNDDPQLIGQGYLHSVDAHRPSPGGEALTVEQVLGGRIPYYTGAVRTSAWQAVGGYEPGIDDIDESVLIWFRLARDFEVRLLPDRLAKYRLRDDSLSRNPDSAEKFERSLIRTFEMLAEESTDQRHVNAANVPLRRLRYHQAARRARWAFSRGDLQSARRLAREAYAQKRTRRAGAAVLLLHLCPEVVVRRFPLIRRLRHASRRARPNIRV